MVLVIVGVLEEEVGGGEGVVEVDAGELVDVVEGGGEGVGGG